MCPESGAMMFMTMRMVVVLPAPLGPSRPDIPSADGEGNVVHGPFAVKILDQVLQ